MNVVIYYRRHIRRGKKIPKNIKTNLLVIPMNLKNPSLDLGLLMPLDVYMDVMFSLVRIIRKIGCVQIFMLKQFQMAHIVALIVLICSIFQVFISCMILLKKSTPFQQERSV